jgi:hypothetical protein
MAPPKLLSGSLQSLNSVSNFLISYKSCNENILPKTHSWGTQRSSTQKTCQFFQSISVFPFRPPSSLTKDPPARATVNEPRSLMARSAASIVRLANASATCTSSGKTCIESLLSLTLASAAPPLRNKHVHGEETRGLCDVSSVFCPFILSPPHRRGERGHSPPPKTKKTRGWERRCKKIYRL